MNGYDGIVHYRPTIYFLFLDTFVETPNGLEASENTHSQLWKPTRFAAPVVSRNFPGSFQRLRSPGMSREFLVGKVSEMSKGKFVCHRLSIIVNLYLHPCHKLNSMDWLMGKFSPDFSWFPMVSHGFPWFPIKNIWCAFRFQHVSTVPEKNNP